MGSRLQTHCKRGHEFTEENTRWDKDGRRRCLICRRAHDRQWARTNAHKARVRCSGCSEGWTWRRGSLCRACRAAEVRRRAKDRILPALRACAEARGRPPTAREWDEEERHIYKATGVTNAIATFGSWRAALEAAALDPDQRMRERAMTPAPFDSTPRDGDKRQARRRVGYLVRRGVLPRPSTLPCTDCGRTWSEGGPRHEYDHHLGYAAEHHEDVEAVCGPCHCARDAARRRETSVA